MYYLRKKPYRSEFKDPVTGKVDFVDYTADRAVFKSTTCGRYYRLSYPHGSNGTRLWTCKQLQTALRHRVALFNYCNEWFDIYNSETNEPISERLYETYKPVKLDTARTTKTLYYNCKTDTLLTTRPKDLSDYKVYRKGTKLYVYNFLDYYGLWEDSNPFSEVDMSDIVILVAKDGNTLIQFNKWEEYTLDGSPLIKTSWEDCEI